MDNERLMNLAKLVIAERRKSAENPSQNKKVPHYLFFVGHPVVQKIYKRWRGDIERKQYPPSDLQRTVWELSLFNNEVLTELEQDLGGQGNGKCV